MSVRRGFFTLIYRFGHPRWDTGITPPEVVAQIEGDDRLQPGSALELGCGTGTTAIYLARHGWDATGVDYVGSAIVTARRKARAAGVRAAFVRGDVTTLAELGVRGPFDFVLDIGCFHGIPAERRPAYAGGVAAVTQPGATLLMFAFGRPGACGFLRFGGASHDVVTRTFGGDFEIVDVVHGVERRPEQPMSPTWYRLRRR